MIYEHQHAMTDLAVLKNASTQQKPVWLKHEASSTKKCIYTAKVSMVPTLPYPPGCRGQ
jgi:3-deoxy-D-arabino-heptulosonate 7-phosphate (DAHP) synthase